MKFPFYFQSTSNDCGPTCLKMVAEYYGRSYSTEFLKKKCRLKRSGTSMLSMSKVVKEIGFHCRGVKMQINKLKEMVQKGPVILHCKKNHFVIAYKTPAPQRTGYYQIADPAKGLIKLKEKEFIQFWIGELPGNSKAQKSLSPVKINSRMVYALLIKP